MRQTRRSFLKGSLAAGMAVGMTAAPAQASPRPQATRPASRNLGILILGGTGFLGPHVVEAARKRGHTVTLFNRGRTNPGLFPDLEKLKGNRDPNKGAGLKALAGRSFDAVLDTSGYYPRMVKASAELLADNIR